MWDQVQPDIMLALGAQEPERRERDGGKGKKKEKVGFLGFEYPE